MPLKNKSVHVSGSSLRPGVRDDKIEPCVLCVFVSSLSRLWFDRYRKQKIVSDEYVFLFFLPQYNQFQDTLTPQDWTSFPSTPLNKMNCTGQRADFKAFLSGYFMLPLPPAQGSFI